jgi:hypothetical protein
MSINLNIFKSKFNVSKKADNKVAQQAMEKVDADMRITAKENAETKESERYTSGAVNTGTQLRETASVSSEDSRLFKEKYNALEEELKYYRPYKEIIKAISGLINIQIENGILEMKKSFIAAEIYSPKLR